MNVVDSSAWLEYFADGPNTARFAPAIQATAELLVPTIVLLEVTRRVYQQRGEDAALQVAAVLHQGTIVPLRFPPRLGGGPTGRHRAAPAR